MKKLETDKELIDLIKDTLENYEEKYILGSWESFVRRKKRRRKLIFWFTGTGIAATLLIGWIGFRVIQSGSPGLNNDLIGQNTGNLEISPAGEPGNEPILIKKIPGITASAKNTRVTGFNNIERSTMRPETGYKNEQGNIDKPGYVSPVTDGIKASDTTYSSELLTDNLSPYIITSGDIYPGKLIRAGNSPGEIREADMLGKELSGRNELNIIVESDLPNKIQKDKFRFGVNLSPGIASTNTLSSFSFSGGINAEYALSGKFLVSTGLQVERQKITSESTDNPAWIPPGQTQADLVDLDLPLNIKWKFLERKSACYYIASGISSVVYLREKYINTSYIQKMVQTVEMSEAGPSINYQLENVKTTDHKTEEPLSTFDFAGRVNIIFGLERHISPGLFLHLEPYVKIPISELATQNLWFTTSGITCKISF